VRIARGGGKRELLDMARLWIETPEFRDPLRGVPDAAIRSDNDSVRSRTWCRRRVIGDFPRGRIESPDEAVLLIRVPDDSVRPDGGIMWESLFARDLVLDHSERRRSRSDQPNHGNQLGEAASVPENHFHPPAMRSLN